MTSPTPSTRRPAIARLLAAITALYACVLAFATHYPKPDDLLGPNAPSDKTLHFLAYATLASLAGSALLASGRPWRSWAARLGVGLAGFGIADEVTQPWFRRHADPIDWVYDCIGIGIGIGLVAVACLGAWMARDRAGKDAT